MKYQKEKGEADSRKKRFENNSVELNVTHSNVTMKRTLRRRASIVGTLCIYEYSVLTSDQPIRSRRAQIHHRLSIVSSIFHRDRVVAFSHLSFHERQRNRGVETFQGCHNERKKFDTKRREVCSRACVTYHWTTKRRDGSNARARRVCDDGTRVTDTRPPITPIRDSCAPARCANRAASLARGEGYRGGKCVFR